MFVQLYEECLRHVVGTRPDIHRQGVWWKWYNKHQGQRLFKSSLLMNTMRHNLNLLCGRLEVSNSA